MAIEIIPKPLAREPVWLNIVFYISIGLLVSIILSYLLLDYFQRNTERVVEEVKASLLVFQTSEEQELERSILRYQKKIDDFAFILKQHQVNSNFFTFFEEITHPEVRFSSINLTKSSAQLSGEAENFVVLNQQLLIFQTDPKISNTSLSQVSLGREGKVGFTFTLTLSPEIFKFQ